MPVLAPPRGLCSLPRMQKVHVNLGDRSYDIQIGGDLLDQLGARCRELGLGRNTLVISDSNVDPLYGERAVTSLEAAGFHVTRVTVPAGAFEVFRSFGRVVGAGH